MAGRRRTRIAQLRDTTGNPHLPIGPRQRTLSAQRRVIAMETRIAAATTPSARIGVTADALRAVIVRLPHHHQEAITDQFVTAVRAWITDATTAGKETA